jgi:uncharacterized membrane protein YeaQ/YmgE (transglycosylase-associated protein family)
MFVFYLVLGGLVIGALGRLAIPGPNPMSIGMTILVGIGGSLAGGIIGWVLTGGRAAGGWVLAVLCAAGIVYLMDRQRLRRSRL